jgi:membrane-bound serine protease (ClpP class)
VKKYHLIPIGFILLMPLTVTVWGEMENTPESKVIYLAEIEGLIAGGTENQFEKLFSKSHDAEAVIIVIDTPGGIATAMENIIKKIQESSIPVIIYVAPSGSQAFSAGTFILLSAHLAAMAPSTSIGACQPRMINPATGLPETAPEKEIKAYTTYIKSIAEARGRNVTIAERFVTENLALSPQEALDAGVIEIVASDINDLLQKATNMTIKGTINGETVILDFTDAKIITLDWNARDVFLNLITDPQIASLLLTIGILGLVFGFLSPGFHVPETVGAICIILGALGLAYIGVNIAGIILVALGILFFIIEALTPTFGFWTTAAIISLIIGIILIPGSDAIYQMPSGWFVSFRIGSIIIAMTLGIFFAYGLTAAWRAKRKKPVTGRIAMIGKKGITTTRLNPRGQVKISGEIWNAESLEGPIPKNTEIVVSEKERLLLKVKKKNKGAMNI